MRFLKIFKIFWGIFAKVYEIFRSDTPLAKMKCGECGKSHPTLLHGIKPSRRSVKQVPKEKERPPAQETPKENPAANELLFLLYINNMPESLKFCIPSMYADDTEIYASAKDCDELVNIINCDFENVRK